MHSWIHPVGVPVQVPGGFEELRLGDVWRVDEVVACLLVTAPGVVLHDPAHGAAAGVEHRQSRADLVGETEQVQLGAELAMVTPLRLGE